MRRLLHRGLVLLVMSKPFVGWCQRFERKHPEQAQRFVDDLLREVANRTD